MNYSLNSVSKGQVLIKKKLFRLDLSRLIPIKTIVLKCKVNEALVLKACVISSNDKCYRCYNLACRLLRMNTNRERSDFGLLVQ